MESTISFHDQEYFRDSVGVALREGLSQFMQLQGSQCEFVDPVDYLGNFLQNWSLISQPIKLQPSVGIVQSSGRYKIVERPNILNISPQRWQPVGRPIVPKAEAAESTSDPKLSASIGGDGGSGLNRPTTAAAKS